MISFILASHNPHKVEEIRQIFQDFHIKIQSLSDLKIYDDIVESGDTLEDNAWIKADYLNKLGYPNVIADDTGLEVDALHGEPGVFSARYAGPAKDSQANIDKLLENLKDNTSRGAQFRTVIAVWLNNERHTFEGVVRGEIDSIQTGKKGFGYDSIFIPQGYQESFGVMSNATKNRISHRGKAISALKNFLKEKI